MKLALMHVLVLFLLSACSGRGSELYFDGNTYEWVNEQDDGTMVYRSAGGQELQILQAGDRYEMKIGTHTYIVTGNERRIEVTYPNGKKGWFEQSGNFGHGGGRVEGHPSASEFLDLVETLNEKRLSEMDGNRLLAGLLFFIFGSFSFLAPYWAWYLGYGWRFRNAEPSDAAILVHRFGGLVMAITGIVFILTSFS